MFPEHVEQSLLDPEYRFAEYFQLGSRRNIRPIKNGLNGFDKIGSIEMGLKFEGSDLSPDLKRGITFASLNTWGKVFLSIQRLYIYRLEFQ